MPARRLVVFCVLLLSACRRGGSARVVLSCDDIQYDSARDASRLIPRSGTSLDSALSRRGQARIVVQGYSYATGGALDRVIRVTMTELATGSRVGADGDRSHAILDVQRGRHVTRITCMGCSRADTVVQVDAGQVDTIDAYLTRFPTSCERGAIAGSRTGTTDAYRGRSNGGLQLPSELWKRRRRDGYTSRPVEP